MVCEGDTDVLPFFETAPMPWFIETLEAFCVVHVSTELPPWLMVSGFALSEHTGRGGGGGGGGGFPPPPPSPSLQHATAAAGESTIPPSVIVGIYIKMPIAKVITARKPMIAENLVMRCI
jgi:hypothetical protein